MPEFSFLFPADTQRIRHAIDVVKPRRDQSDLKDSCVIKPVRSQALVILRRDARGIPCELRNVIKHHPVSFGNRRLAIIILEGFYQVLVQRYATQKLCVRFDSIVTAIEDRNDRGNHLVLAPR